MNDSGQAPKSNEQSAAEGADNAAVGRVGKAAKGCGCLVVSVILASSVAFAAGGDAGAWAAGISGVLFLVMVVATSGSNGFWGLRG
jgi:hypothetical protein